MPDFTYIGGGRRSGRTTKLVALATFYAETNSGSTNLFLTHNYQDADRILRMLADSAHLTARIERSVSKITYENGARVKMCSASGDLDRAVRGFQPLIVIADNVHLWPQRYPGHWRDVVSPLNAPVWYTDDYYW